MAIKIPAWMVNLRAEWRAYLSALLSLLLIWGVASFAWGSLNVWAKRNALSELDKALVVAEAPLSVWLESSLVPMKPLLEDTLLIRLTQLSLGLASPAAQRWVDDTTQTPLLKDLVLADFATGRTLFAVGNSMPPAELLARLAALEVRKENPFLMASGRSNAMFYFVQPLHGTSSTMLILPRSLRQIGAFAPALTLPTSTTVTLNFPHANGQWARWNPTNPLRLETVDSSVIESPPHLAIKHDLNGFNDVVLQAEWEGVYPPPPITGIIAIFAWAMLMSIVVLWRWLKPWVDLGKQKLAPVVAPLLQGVKRATAGPMALLDRVGGQVFGGVKKGLASVQGVAQVVGPKWLGGGKTDPDNWRKSGNDEAAKPTLTDGPGEYAAYDFNSANENNGGKKNQHKYGKLPVLKPLSVHDNKQDHIDSQAVLREGQTTEDELREEDGTLTSRIVRCLNEGLVELLYQPMYTLADGVVFANEVLARLVDQEGQISPAQFIPILGSMGKLSELDALVFEKVIALHFNGRVSSTQLSINISGNSLEDLGYLREVATQGPDVLQHLIFEVRGNEVVRDPNALKLLKTLQRQGAKVAIDYFGGGAGMVQATQAIGLDIIKADAKRVTDKESKKDLLEMCLAAAKLDFPVVLEKVEDVRMEDFARRSGVKLVQGYSLGKPGPNLTTLPLSARLTK